MNHTKNTSAEATEFAVVYCRLSKREMEQRAYSSLIQKEIALHYARTKGLRVRVVVEDSGISGAISFFQRPAGKTIKKMIDGGWVKHIIVSKADRFYRALISSLAFVEELQEQGVDVHVVQGMFSGKVDLDNPDTYLAFVLQSSMSEMERQRIKHRTQEALNFRKRAGLAYTHCVFGYKKVQHGASILLLPDESQVAALRYMLAQRTLGVGWLAISRGLNTKGYRAPRLGAFTRTSTRDIFSRCLKDGRLVALLGETECANYSDSPLYLADLQRGTTLTRNEGRRKNKKARFRQIS